MERLTVSQSWLSCSGVRDFTLFWTFWRRVTAVPGYSESIRSFEELICDVDSISLVFFPPSAMVGIQAFAECVTKALVSNRLSPREWMLWELILQRVCMLFQFGLYFHKWLKLSISLLDEIGDETDLCFWLEFPVPPITVSRSTTVT